MSLWSRVRGRKADSSAASDSDAGVDEVHSGNPDDTGGEPQGDAADSNSSTGTTPNETVVGRVSGADDPGSLESGAEKREEESDGDDGSADGGARYGAAR